MKFVKSITKIRKIPGPYEFLSKLFSHYGMLTVLLLLCVYYSFATITEHHPSGKEAADSIVKSLSESASVKKLKVLIIAKNTAEDTEFANSISRLLSESDHQVMGIVCDEPAKVRKRFQTMLYGEIDTIITTKGYKTIVRNIKNRFQSLSSVEILVPEGYTWPTFLLTSNLLNVANQIVVIAIIAVGMTMVIITGGIDLSVGSLVAFSSVMAAWLIKQLGGVNTSFFGMLIASSVAILLCGFIGAFSGLMVTRFKLPPFIATLGMMQVASGIAYIISEGKPIYEIPDSFVTLGRETTPFLSLPYAVILMGIIYIVAHILMGKTIFGRHVYAVGGNKEASRLSGIRVNLILIAVYTICGIVAGLGGIVMTSQLKSGAPTYGLMYELYVIAAVVVGGTSLSGGEGKIFGTLIGAFIIAVIQNGMNLTNVQSYTQKVVLGLVILSAVLLDMLKRRKPFPKLGG